MDRKRFLKSSLVGSAGFLLPSATGNFVPNSFGETKPVFRFAVGGDLHYGAGEYQKNAENLVTWLNKEKSQRGLDLFFLNGDLVHDVTDKYQELRDEYLSDLTMPYFAVKGNHDYLEEGQTWESIWGYPSNQIVEAGPIAFIFADTSRGNNQDSTVYTAPDLNWFEQAIDLVSDKEAVFIILHIAQRKEGNEGWPKNWPRFGVGHYDNSRAIEAEKVVSRIEKTENIKAIFHGHNHDIIENYLTSSSPNPHGKPYFFCSRMGHTWGNKIGYRIVEIYENGSSRTYQFDPVAGQVLNTNLIEMIPSGKRSRKIFKDNVFNIRCV